jgi:signal transduction histidine kinase
MRSKFFSKDEGLDGLFPEGNKPTCGNEWEDMKPSEKKDARIGYLEKLARSNLYELGLLASLGEHQHSATLAGDTSQILKICEEHLQRLMDFKVISFFMVRDEDSEFILEAVEPEGEKSKIENEVRELIINGSFAWAVNQCRPVVVSSSGYKNSLILHVLGTRSRVRGMFVGVLEKEDGNTCESALYPISIILQNTSFALESAVLNKLISDQNKNLEAIVQERTKTLEEQTYELKQEIAFRRLAEESLVVAKEEAERAANFKSDFITKISHEFRTPLNAILGYCEIIQFETKNLNLPKIDEDLKAIEISGRHLLGLFNDILDFSKMKAGVMDVNLENVKVMDMVEDVMSTIRPLARKNRNTISVTQQGFVDTMYSDPGRVRQILLNLLGNASKFTEEGAVSLKVISESIDQVDWLTFSITDTGIGISTKMIPQLFKEFSQSGGSVARKNGGAGLGLAISRRLCQVLGGDISVKSELGRGSVFTVRLPKDASLGETLPVEQGGPAGSFLSSNETSLIKEPELAGLFPTETHEPQKNSTGVSSRESGKTILVVEDDATNRGALCRILRREGWEVAEAVDGKTAMCMVETEVPLLIILDLVLPNVSGFDFLAKLGQNENFRNVPVIVLTAKELSSDEKKLLKEKANCVFQKGNFSRKELIEKIHVLIEADLHPR